MKRIKCLRRIGPCWEFIHQGELFVVVASGKRFEANLRGHAKTYASLDAAVKAAIRAIERHSKLA